MGPLWDSLDRVWQTTNCHFSLQGSWSFILIKFYAEPSSKLAKCPISVQDLRNSLIVQWLISDLIPKKSEKFEFWKNFSTMFSSVKNWPKITKFWYLKLVKFSRNWWKKPKTSEWAKYPKKWEFSKKSWTIHFLNSNNLIG